ncbi:hypothetical protein EDB86DRAFT_2826052 [Lactarius hatsudake]|nr:hypothetical protein EDB86DRAFT_2826052 [Lactarius hatsudake]
MSSNPDYILILNNYLQRTGEAHLLSWEFSQIGPEHQATHTAVAKRMFTPRLFSLMVPLMAHKTNLRTFSLLSPLEFTTQFRCFRAVTIASSGPKSALLELNRWSALAPHCGNQTCTPRGHEIIRYVRKERMFKCPEVRKGDGEWGRRGHAQARRPEGNTRKPENDQYTPWCLEVNHRPAFTIVIPGSDVASDVHNLRGS